MYRFIESIRWEKGRAELLNYHQERVNETFRNFFPESKPFLLSEFIKNNSLPINEEVCKLRLVYHKKIERWESLPYRQKIPKHWFLREIKDYKYNYKYENREVLNSISHDLPPLSDFIISQNGWISDSYYANLIFWDGVNWLTPKNYLLNGIRRQYLLDKGEIVETEIHRDDLSKFTHFKRINALIAFDESPSFDLCGIKT